MNRLLVLFSIFSLYLYAITTDEIIKKVEDNLNGKTLTMTLSMEVYTKKTKRKMAMESFSVGTEKSFIKITYPKKSKGITFLKIGNSMWQYVPKIERVIKIPASMMLQSWMGSDFTNDDLVKESSISEDYNHELLLEDDNVYKLKLMPKDDAAVVWGKIIMNISKEYYLPAVVEYFDEDDELVRVLEYKDIKKFENKYYPTYWVMTPKTQDKIGHKTVVSIKNVQFDKDIDKSYFTKRALKRYSK